MSSTNRGGQRSPADFYPTPAWCVHRLLENHRFRAAAGLDVPGPKRWLEPCVGDGAIIRAVREVEPGIVWSAGDIRPDASCDGLFVRVGDFLSAKPGFGWGEDIGLVISNPPFSLAEPIIRHADVFSDSVVMLLRLAFLSSGKRAPFMRERTPDVYVLPNRPSFDGIGNDSPDYGWFHWHGSPGRRGHVVILESTEKAERRPPRADR